VGAVVTQLVMAAVLVAAAATIRPGAPQASLGTVGDISQALTPLLGQQVGRMVFGVGVLGAGLVAAIVTSLALAWGLGEVSGYRRSLEYQPSKAPWFYAVYCICVIGGAAAVAVAPDLVSLNVGVQVMNALLLPLVLGFLVRLAMVALPAKWRPRGWYLCTVIAVSVITCALGVVGGVGGLFQ
jgi:Mn2+/Fe2+ NRAMP family transporter